MKSIEFRDQNISDILLTLGELNDVSIVPDETVTGKASYVFSNMDFKQALQVFLDTFKLSYTLKNSFYYDAWADTTATETKNPVNGDQVWVRHYNPFGQVAYEQNNSNQAWSYSYDPRGLLIGQTDPKGTAIVNSYSLTGLLTQKTLTNGNQSQVQSWSYDIAGSPMGGSDGSVSTAINQGSGSYIPDPYDLVNTYTTTVGSKSLSLSYSYDNGHRPISITYPDSVAVSYQYNGLDELTAIPGYASNGKYNYMGRLTSLQASNGTQRTKTWNATAGTLDGYGWKVSGKSSRSLGWDKRGNLTSQSKDGTSNSYVYDELCRLEYASEGGQFETRTDDTMPQGSRERDVAGAKGLDYSNPGSSVKLDYHATSVGVNLTSQQSISKVRLIGVSSRINPRTVEVYLSSDGVDGNWSQVTDTTWLPDESGVTLQFAQAHQGQFVKLHMTWDERDENNQAIDAHTIAGPVAQLIEVWYDHEGQTTSWTYDTLGNRVLESKTRAHNVQTNYSYYPNTSRIKEAGSWEFDYDANGNMTARGASGSWNSQTNQYDWSATVGELYVYSYDLKNRLVEVQHGISGSASLKSVAQYTYDMRDLRIETVKNTGTVYTQYGLVGELLWHEDETTQTKYIEALGQTWAEVRSTGTTSQVYFHSPDHEGSTDVISDGSGNIVWDGDYEAFGSVARSKGTIGFTPSYTGKEFDADTGLYYYNSRFYDPTLGRFLNCDPARDGNNWYAYVSNNPMSRIDPTGLFGLDDVNAGLNWFGNSFVPGYEGLHNAVDGAFAGDLKGVGLGLAKAGLDVGSAAMSGGLAGKAAEVVGAKLAQAGAKKAESAITKEVQGIAKQATEAAGKVSAGKAKATGDVPSFTYRGDNTSPDKIFSEGFSPRGTSEDLFLHAVDNRNPGSNYVSTSKSADVASGFADNVYVVRNRQYEVTSRI
jgi:RHS repeat-associated protein